MRKGESASFKKILVAIDGSPTSAKAASYAIHLAEMECAELIALHVIEDVKQGGVIGLRAKYGDVKLVEAFRNVRTEAASEFMSPVIESATKAGVKAKSELLLDEGESEAGAITKYAARHGVDLIVLGSRSRSGLGRRLLLVGGVANKVLNLAKCPVLIVR
jgi:nucleotide-binding universal stress UspA family protein